MSDYDKLQHHLAEITRLITESGKQDAKEKTELEQLREQKRKRDRDFDKLERRNRELDRIRHNTLTKNQLLQCEIGQIQKRLETSKADLAQMNAQAEKEKREFSAKAEDRVNAEREKWQERVRRLEEENERLTQRHVESEALKKRLQASVGGL